MKKYIKNKVYDTDTARFIGKKRYGIQKESLYQKKTGEFFLYYECDVIKPISFSEAQKWAKENLSNEEYDATFKVAVDDSKRVQMGINVSSTVADKLRKRSTELGMSISGWIEYLVNNAE